MRTWAKFMFLAAAPLLLASCLWGPGKFSSTLSFNKNGTFVLDYRGEIMLQLPQDGPGEAGKPWSDDMATCSEEGETFLNTGIELKAEIIGSTSLKPMTSNEKADVYTERPCTPAELADLKAHYEKQNADRADAKRKESEQMAKMFGLPGSDDASNRAFAAKLMKYAGWRSVAYKGKGVFDVDYHFEGRTSQDFVFPLMPDNELIVPFIALRRRTDGSLMMTAPALGGNPFAARARAMGMPDKGDGPPSRAEGRFTVITDGEILTNNSEDGPAPHAAGRQVHWDVSPASTKTPEMLVRF